MNSSSLAVSALDTFDFTAVLICQRLPRGLPVTNPSTKLCYRCSSHIAAAYTKRMIGQSTRQVWGNNLVNLVVMCPLVKVYQQPEVAFRGCLRCLELASFRARRPFG